jgi:bifunctional DNA-binding transcriptional regulator/antitoxin component of YhaV-PrlF toxin-antitoxin module
MTSGSISPLDLGRTVIEALGIKPGESFKITTTRDGRLILARKAEP